MFSSLTHERLFVSVEQQRRSFTGWLDSLTPPPLLLRRVGQCGRRSQRLSGRAWRSGLGPQGSGETGRREPARNEQEAAEHVGGAADQEHAPAEGNESRAQTLERRVTGRLTQFISVSLQDLELLSRELVRLSKEAGPGGSAAGSG